MRETEKLTCLKLKKEAKIFWIRLGCQWGVSTSWWDGANQIKSL